MPTTDIEAAASKLPDLIDAASRGEEVVITRDGAPVARLVPTSQGTLRQGGFLRGHVKILDPGWAKPDPELEALFYDGPVFPEDDRGTGSSGAAAAG